MRLANGQVEVRLALRGWTLANLASIEAVRGREWECRAWASEAERLGARANWPVLAVWAAHARGLLDLGLGNVASAHRHLTQCDRLADDHGLDDPAVLRHEPDLVEALLARNDVQGACLVAARAQERADRLGATWALASAARCRGMLATDTDFAAQFETALVLHDHLPRPFERARIQLAFGERLRRARRRGEARTPLADSLAAFDALGARPWADRAARELRATVVTARRREFSWDDDLTPQEQRVALILANGATVREAAGQLFLSPKTIEAHLGRAYRKLGVRNRAELASRLLPIDAGALPGVS